MGVPEFLASNSGGLRDQDGAASDWVELYNAGDAPVNLDGWFLTDNAADLDTWRFPAVTLVTGEFLGLVRPDLTIADAFTPAFPP